jgi:hypothetical protein
VPCARFCPFTVAIRDAIHHFHRANEYPDCQIFWVGMTQEIKTLQTSPIQSPTGVDK